MFSYKKQMAYILLLAVILMWCGLYAAYYNMQKATLWPDDNFFALNTREGALHIKLLGMDLVVNKRDLSPQPFIERLTKWGQESVDKLRQFR